MSTIKLPPLPPLDVGVYGLAKFAYSKQALIAYAEEAVRQALAEAAAKLEVLAREAFERLGVAGTVHMAYHQAIATILANPPETRDG